MTAIFAFGDDGISVFPSFELGGFWALSILRPGLLHNWPFGRTQRDVVRHSPCIGNPSLKFLLDVVSRLRFGSTHMTSREAVPVGDLA